MRYLGAHTIDTGGIPMAARRAGASGMRALQCFTAVPKYYNEKVSIKPDRVARFREALATAGIDRRHVIVHAGYVINAATPEAEKWERAAAALSKELERSTLLGAAGVCFHPGAATDGDRDAAVARVAVAMTRALETVAGDTRLLVENSAGAGTTIGRTAEEVGAILAALAPEHRARSGYGLDTCHLLASGYDIASTEQRQREVLDTWVRVTGERPRFFHLNDSVHGLGTNKDRHARIGEGHIGAPPFGWLLRDPITEEIPLILETPQAKPDVADDDATGDAWDIETIALLERMASGDA
ncbi:MAG: deoxyribonuclease IV [Gemmatimonadaceae bacterium]|jgi:deoxyribonuclease-4|nr:deoxyribonuclease IV [Gemmatimonadaceae bacterium]